MSIDGENQDIQDVSQITHGEDIDLDLGADTQLVPAVTSNDLTESHQISLNNILAASKQIAKMKEPRELSVEFLNHHKIIHAITSQKNIVDIYRDVRTKLLHLSKGRNFVALITSVVEGGGASHFTVNLASSFAFDSTKTSLIVDCDIFNSSIEHMLNAKCGAGFTDFICDENIDISQIIYPSGIRRLRFIPVGAKKTESIEYFTSIRMRILIDAIKRRYSDRYIFLDSPSIGDSADSRILADLCDFIILIIPNGEISESKLEKVLDSIDQKKIAGVVFNK